MKHWKSYFSCGFFVFINLYSTSECEKRATNDVKRTSFLLIIICKLVKCKSNVIIPHTHTQLSELKWFTSFLVLMMAHTMTKCRFDQITIIQFPPCTLSFFYSFYSWPSANVYTKQIFPISACSLQNHLIKVLKLHLTGVSMSNKCITFNFHDWTILAF